MKLSKLNIGNEVFVYEDELYDITYDNSTAISEKDAQNLLMKTKELFSSINLNFYLAYGTLLGAIRDKGIIPGDEDVDVFTDDEEKLYQNLPFLYKNGYKLCRMKKGKLYSFRINDKSYIDVYILRPYISIWGLYCYSLSNHATPKKYFKEYQDIEFLGEIFRCPRNPEKLIEFWYGKDWEKPRAGKKYYYEVASAHYWHHYIKPLIASVIKFIIGWKYWKKRTLSNEQ